MGCGDCRGFHGCGLVGFVVIVVACFVSEKRETKRKREKEIEMVMNKKKILFK